MTTQYISSTGQKTSPLAGWDNTYAYNAGDMVYANGNVYIANAAIAAGQPWTVDGTHFQLAVMGAVSASSISNGNSNVSIASSAGNITASANGIANIVVVSANATVSKVAVTGNVTATNIDAGNLLTANYIHTGEIANGTSAMVVNEDSDIIFSANAISNVLVLQSDGNIGSQAEEFNTTGNIKFNTTSRGAIFVGADAAPALTNYQVFVNAPNVADFTANYTLTLPPNAGSNLQFLQTDGDGVLKWSDASIKVTVANSSTTKPTSPLSGDALIVTTNGNANGTTTEEWLYSGSANSWVQVKGATPVGSSIVDNTISDSDNVVYVGTYIVPTSGLANAFVGHANAYAAFDGSGYTFTSPTNNDTVLITGGTYAGQTWKYTTAGGWAISTGGALTVFNWVLSQAYPAGSIVVYNNNLYQANSNIPANTAWATGVSGLTWRALSSGGAYNAQTFTATAGQTQFTLSQVPVGGVAININGVMVSANSVSVTGTLATYNPTNNGSYSLLAGDQVTITYMYGSINTNLVNAELGQVQITGQTTAALTGTWADISTASYAINTAGTFELSYAIMASSSQWWGLRIINTADSSVVAGSSSQYSKGDSTAELLMRTVQVTTTGATTYKLQIISFSGAQVTIYNTPLSTGGAASGQSSISWKKISGFTPITSLTSTTTALGDITTGNVAATGTITGTKILAVPTWTSAGTIQTVGVGITSGGTAPTLATTTQKNGVYYRQLGPKEWEVQMTYAAASATGATPGSGDYLFTLPNGLSFDTTLPFQKIDTTNVGGTVFDHAFNAMDGVTGFIATTADCSYHLMIIPYNATQYRVALRGVTNTATKPFGSGNFALTIANMNFHWRFSFQST